MKQTVIKKMDEDYKTLLYARFKNGGIKYCFKYNDVDVNIYYDHFDEISASMILILNYNKYSYCTSLNVNLNNPTEYLKNIDSEILQKILDDEKKLIDFYDKINDHILKTDPIRINYTKDNNYQKNKNKNKNKNNNFFLTLRKANFENKHFKECLSNFDITYEQLNSIRKNGFTLVTTNDSTKRKNLKAILNQHNIEIK